MSLSEISVDIEVLPESFAVCRMDPGREVRLPEDHASIYSLTRTSAELSLVCPTHLAPDDARVEPGWSAMVVAGPLDFSLTGILASIAGPLATAQISIFAVSTFDTDYILVRSADCDAAVRTLEAAGHTVAR